MNLIIKIREKNGQQLVSGKELYKFLNYDDEDWLSWSHKNIRLVESFIENEDYLVIDDDKENIDYLLTINVAIKLLVLFNTPKSIEIRKYFIKCEEEWNKDEMVLARALKISNQKVIEYKNKINILEEKTKENINKLQYTEKLENSNECILIREFSKILANEKIKLGEKMLYRWFRERGFILKNSTEPSQKTVENGFFKVIHGYAKTYRGDIPIKTTKITRKGQIYFLNIIKKEFQNKIIS